MDRQALRHAIDLLMDRVRMETTGDQCRVWFDDLDRDAMVALGIEPGFADHFAAAPWWAEMIDDVAETPDFCEDDTTPEELHAMARDVVQEYVAKRF
jgi:hypothetical protein